MTGEAQTKPAEIPTFVANACECRICGALADRHGMLFQCQENPGHIADTMTGLFQDRTDPSGNSR